MTEITKSLASYKNLIKLIDLWPEQKPIKNVLRDDSI